MHTTPFFDYLAYKEWIYNTYSLGFKKAYEQESNVKVMAINQPPGTILILRGSYEVFLLTARGLSHFLKLAEGSTLWINDNLLVFFFRLPSMLADIILGFCIYLFVKSKSNEKTGLVASGLYLLGPPIIYNSTVWGQMDSINNLFFYLSLVFLIAKKPFLSILFLALSLFVKLSLLPLVPFYFLLALFGGFFKRKAFIISVIVTGFIIWILTLPFASYPLWFFDFLKFASGGINNDITANAYNFWWLVYNPVRGISPPDVNTIVAGWKLLYIATFIFVAFSVPILVLSWNAIKKRKLTPTAVFFAFSLLAFAAFLFLPKMHERYLYPVFPLLITWVALTNKFWITLILLLIVHFLNLYIVWNPNLFLWGGPAEDMLKSQASMWILSLITVILFAKLYFQWFVQKKSAH